MDATETEPLLAAVVICRNEVRWIDACLTAVRQAVAAHPGGDVVVVDGASTDGTLARVAAHPVRLVELRPDAPLTPALGRVVGERRSASRYVLFVDGDTEIDSAWVRAAVEHCERHPEVAAVGGKLAEIWYDGDRVVGRVADVFGAPDAVDEVEELGGNCLVRRAALERAGSFNPHLTSFEESELVARLRHDGGRVVRLPIPMGTHHTGVRGSLRELARRYRHDLIRGYGQVLRLSLAQGTWRLHARRMHRHLEFQLAVLLGLAAAAISLVLRTPWPIAAWAGAAALAFAAWAMRARSLVRPLQTLVGWAVWAPPMIRGFLARPRHPAALPLEQVVARERHCGPAAGARPAQRAVSDPLRQHA